MLYEFLMKVLKTYGIENRINSVTRDNAGSMNVMMDKYKYRERLRSQDIEFDGDIRCMSHVMNLSTVTLLNYIFFKGKASEKFSIKLWKNFFRNTQALKILLFVLRVTPITYHAIDYCTNKLHIK